MTNPLIQIHDVSSDLVEVREMNETELEEWETIQKASKLEADQLIQAQAEAQATKQSVTNKLAALGLTPEEISAITGA
jgi:hypothetical protein